MLPRPLLQLQNASRGRDSNRHLPTDTVLVTRLIGCQAKLRGGPEMKAAAIWARSTTPAHGRAAIDLPFSVQPHYYSTYVQARC